MSDANAAPANGTAAFEALKGFVGEAQERLGVPGVAIGLRLRGVEHTAGLGVTSIEHPLEVDPNTLFQIGSITKTFTATAVMRLVEAGRLELDRPVRAYLPELRLSDARTAAEVTLRHLLTHTAGWEGDDFSDPGWGDDALARYVAGMAQLPQIVPIGETWSYCNSGFDLAGRIIEVATGKTFEAALRNLVLEPLGMANAFLSPVEVMTHRFAVGHYVRDDGVVVGRPWPIPRASNAAGGISTCVSELLTYARFAMGDGAPLLRKESLALMHAPLVKAGGMADHIGLAWMQRTVDGVRVVEHSGGTNGQTCTLKLVPERDFALIVLTNADRGPLLFNEVAAFTLQKFLGVQQPEPDVQELPVERLRDYAGRYEMRTSSIELTLHDTGLVAQVTDKGGFPTSDSPPRPKPPPTRVVFYADDRILALDPPLKGGRGEFLRDSAGHIVWLRWGGRLAARELT